MNFFTYLEEADFQKPIWSSYSGEPKDITNLLNYLPKTFAQFVKRSVPQIELSSKLSFAINTCDTMDLPKFDETKKLTCPGATTIKDVINFAHGKIGFEKHIICPPNQ